MVAVAAAVVPLGLCAAPSANAHATLEYSTPVDGARVEVAPAQVTLTFDEPVQLVPGTAQVVSDDGARGRYRRCAPVDRRGDPRHSSSARCREGKLFGGVARHLGRHAYRVRIDQLRCGSGCPCAPRHKPTLARPHRRRRCHPGCSFLGVILCLGLTLRMRDAVALDADADADSRADLDRMGLDRLRYCRAVSVRGSARPRPGWAHIFAGSAVSETLHGRTGAVLIGRVVVLLLVAAVTRRIIKRSTVASTEPDVPGVAMLIAGAALLTVSVAALGHAARGRDSWLAIPVTAVHMLMMAVWVGGLIALVVAVLPQRNTDNLRRWSQTALCCVSSLVITGGYQAWRQVYPVQAMWSTSYGVTLTVKLALVLAMLALGYIARRNLSPAVAPNRARRGSTRGGGDRGHDDIGVTTTGPRHVRTVGLAVAPLDTRTAAIHITSTRRGPTAIEVTARDPAGDPAQARFSEGHAVLGRRRRHRP